MYRAFNLILNENSNLFSSSSSRSESMLNNYQYETHNCLEKYLSKSSILDGSKMQDDWFPEIQADIFISHSHSDLETAKKVSSWLYDKFQLKAFIDSNVWGHSEHLLKMIDDEYCLQSNGETYDYKKRNQSTSHVYMMLANALVKMMDRCECILFLNTPNSIKAESIIKKTHSPWIYHEISSIKTMRVKEPERPILEAKHETFSKTANKYVPIEYTLDFSDFAEIDYIKLLEWEKEYSRNQMIFNNDKKHALDTLYQKVGIRR